MKRKNLISFFTRFSPRIWFLTGITFLTRSAAFMMLPLFVEHLSSLGMGAGQIGLIQGSGWILGSFGGLIVGYIADRKGYKTVTLAMLLLWASTFFAYSYVQSFEAFFLISLLNGFCRSSIDVVILSRMYSEVSEENRDTVINLNNMALNAGMVLGPLLGVYLDPIFAFHLAGAIFIGITLLDFIFGRSSQAEIPSDPPGIRDTAAVLFRDRGLFWLVVAAFLFMTAYAQIESTLPQVLSLMDRMVWFAPLLTVNAGVVILFSPLILAGVKKLGDDRGIMVGSALFGLGLLSFSASSLPLFFVGMFLISAGEVILFPLVKKAISVKGSRRNMLATYEGVFNFANLGFSVGPMLGGFLLAQGGTLYLFGIMAGIGSLTAIAYFLASPAPQAKLSSE